MSVNIRYFASIREQLGRENEVIELNGASSAVEIWAQLTDKPWPANMLVAINQEHACPEDPVADGDELGFFPPVTGG